VPGLADSLLLRTGPWLASWVIRLLHASLRVRYLNLERPRGYWARQRPVILAFWHDQLLLMVKGYRGPEARILISPSKDGELIARTMQHFGQGAVRGSSSRGGSSALREMVRLKDEVFDLVVTPDGPKGPRHQVKPGVAQLAKLTGRAVIPMAFACSRGHRFASWDRFLLPYPFARGVYSFGEPLTFEADETVESFSVRLEKAMEENVAQAVRYLEDAGVSAV